MEGRSGDLSFSCAWRLCAFIVLVERLSFRFEKGL